MIGGNKMRSLWQRFVGVLQDHPIVAAAVVIYGYYLLTSINLMGHTGKRANIMDFLFQFDSLILLWVIAYVVVKMQTYSRRLKEEEEYKRQIVSAYERERAHLQILDDVASVLNDNINNPLAIISVSTSVLREKYQLSNEIVDTLDRVDSAVKRIRHVLQDIRRHQTEKIVTSIPPPTNGKGTKQPA